ncbi:MAG: hypothetical protein IIX00_06190 [Tidjanibacter sp.]|nr:hypothetical protein [Tidjanibacter sp.]
MEERAKCPRCGFTQEVEAWIFAADYEHDGRYVAGAAKGDHARCPNCNKLLHIDYDLLDE